MTGTLFMALRVTCPSFITFGLSEKKKNAKKKAKKKKSCGVCAVVCYCRVTLRCCVSFNPKSMFASSELTRCPAGM